MDQDPHQLHFVPLADLVAEIRRRCLVSIIAVNLRSQGNDPDVRVLMQVEEGESALTLIGLARLAEHDVVTAAKGRLSRPPSERPPVREGGGAAE